MVAAGVVDVLVVGVVVVDGFVWVVGVLVVGVVVVDEVIWVVVLAVVVVSDTVVSTHRVLGLK